ncbi:MAG: tetratricopeptide repeat protein [Anaerolineae bacterium]
MQIKRDPPGSGRLTFRRRRKRFPILPVLLYVGVLAAAGVVWLQRDSLQPQVVAAFGPTPTPTPSIVEMTTQGEIAFYEGRLAVAETYYRQAVEVDPNNVDALFWLSHVLTLEYIQSRDIDKLEEALAVAEQAITVDPEDPQGYAARSRALNWLGDYSAAANAASKALEIDANYALGRAYLAEAYVDLGRLRQALTEAERAVELDPYSVEARRNYAWVLAHYGSYNNAIIQYEQALRIQPNRPDLMYELALNYRWSGDYDSAIATFEEILLLSPDNPVTFYVEIGKTYFEQREDGAAQEFLGAAVQLVCNEQPEGETGSTEDQECPRNPGVWELSDSQYDQWRSSPDNLPDNVFMPAWTLLGQVYYTRRNFEDAVDIFEEAIAYGEENDVEVPIETYYLTALAYYYLNECDRGVPLAEYAFNRLQDDIASSNEPPDASTLTVQNNILSVFVLCRDFAGDPYTSTASGFTNGFPEGFTEPDVVIRRSDGSVVEENEEEMMVDEE